MDLLEEEKVDAPEFHRAEHPLIQSSLIRMSRPIHSSNEAVNQLTENLFPESEENSE